MMDRTLSSSPSLARDGVRGVKAEEGAERNRGQERGALRLSVHDGTDDLQGMWIALEASARHGRMTARAHLQRKYDYLLKKDMVDSAEQFIERAASQSSMSGKPYRIQCPGQPEQTAAAWFGARLQALRHRTP